MAGPENSKFIYTALLEYFITQLKLALFGAGFISFPIVATQIYKFVAPGLYKHERGAFLPYLIATPVFFVLGSMLVYFVVLPMLVRFSLGMQQAAGAQSGGVGWTARGGASYWLSYSAKAGYPVRCGLTALSLTALEYWMPAFAGMTVSEMLQD